MDAARRLWKLAPPGVKRAALWGLRNRPGQRVSLGGARRTAPASDCFGWDRGTPMDRRAIEAFLAENRNDIQGRCAEVRSGSYTRRFGGTQVTELTVIDRDGANAEATLVADLCEPSSLPRSRFDCIVLTQTIQFLAEPGVALANLYSGLAPGGVLLVTAPSLSRIDPESRGGDYWRYTPDGLRQLLRTTLPGAELWVTGHGNVLLGVAFLLGLAAEELTPDELAQDDPDFPLLAFARVRKPPPGR